MSKDRGARPRRMPVWMVAWVLGCVVLSSEAARAQFSTEVSSLPSPFDPVIEVELIPADLQVGDGLGVSTDVQGDLAVLSAHRSDDIALDAGAAYVFRDGPSGWQVEQKLAPADLGAGDQFGYSLSLDGDVIVVSAPRHGALGSEEGAVYVYRHDGNAWVMEQKLLPSVPLLAGRFGTDVAVSGDWLAVGRYVEVDGQLGVVHMYRYDGADWIEEDTVSSADTVTGDLYAYALALDGDELAVGAYKDEGSGSIYFHRLNGTSWEFKQKVFSFDGEFGDLFSKGISMHDGVLVTGANREDQLGDDAGAAYVFRFDGNNWVHEQKLLASDGRAQDRFGTHVGLHGDLIVVGARLDDNPGLLDGGSAYIFRWDGTTWVETRKLIGADTAPGDWSGHTVATDGTTVMVNAPGHGHGGIAPTGGTYAYTFPLHGIHGALPTSVGPVVVSPAGVPVILLATVDETVDPPRRTGHRTGLGPVPCPGLRLLAVDGDGRVVDSWPESR